MGILKSLRGPDVDAFAKQLAGELAARYPATLEQSPQKRISVNRITRLLEETFAQAESFKNEHHLGWLKKAKLGNNFRWELKELGYSDQFIEMATEGLIVYITRKSAAGAEPPKST
jgi:hypothetical protein